MSLVTESQITVDGIEYNVEHCEDGGMERIILWGIPTVLIGDAFVNHNRESITVHLHTSDGGTCTESYDYWAYANEDNKEAAVEELARWIGSVA